MSFVLRAFELPSYKVVLMYQFFSFPSTCAFRFVVPVMQAPEMFFFSSFFFYFFFFSFFLRLSFLLCLCECVFGFFHIRLCSIVNPPPPLGCISDGLLLLPFFWFCLASLPSVSSSSLMMFSSFLLFVFIFLRTSFPFSWAIGHSIAATCFLFFLCVFYHILRNFHLFLHFPWANSQVTLSPRYHFFCVFGSFRPLFSCTFVVFLFFWTLVTDAVFFVRWGLGRLFSPPLARTFVCFF